MMKVYYASGSRSVRVLWLLEELGLPYEAVKVNFPARLRDQPYLELNPSGTVPALIDGDVTLTESMPICEYLARRRPAARLLPEPGDIDETTYAQWLWFGEATLMFPIAAITRARRHGIAADHPLMTDLTGILTARLGVLERRLADRETVSLGRFTLADISCVFPLYRLQQLELSEYVGQHSMAYYRRLSGRPAFAAALAW